MTRRDDIIIIRSGEAKPEVQDDKAGKALLAIFGFMALMSLGNQNVQQRPVNKGLELPPQECSGECASAYRSFLASSGGRAFIVSENGVWSWHAGAVDNDSAVAAAMSGCADAGGIGCHAAVVGWQRIGQAAGTR